MNSKRIIVFIIGLGLLVAAILFLSEDIVTPYVPFTEAVASPGKHVQVIGKLNKSIKIKYEGDSYFFTAIDKDGSSLNIQHNGVKPLNFEDAEQIVALGRYDDKLKIFNAEKILVKCPSKYKKGNVK